MNEGFTCMTEPRTLPDRRIELTWSDGAISRFHFVWLRQQHFHPAIGRPEQGDDDELRLPDDPQALSVESCRQENDLVYRHVLAPGGAKQTSGASVVTELYGAASVLRSGAAPNPTPETYRLRRDFALVRRLSFPTP